MYLYLDTTERLVIGLLDEDFNWLDYCDTDIRNAASKIQALIYKLLKDHNSSVTNLNAIFQASGPGSYTGMRVSEGLCQVFEWHDLPIYSFYHFDVPKILGVAQGTWSANAYKGDVFLFDWNGESEVFNLIKLEDVKKTQGDDLYSHYYKEPFDSIKQSNLTSYMIKNSSGNFFTYIRNNKMRREPYYYRSLDIEFTKPKRNE